MIFNVTHSEWVNMLSGQERKIARGTFHTDFMRRVILLLAFSLPFQSSHSLTQMILRVWRSCWIRAPPSQSCLPSSVSGSHRSSTRSTSSETRWVTAGRIFSRLQAWLQLTQHWQKHVESYRPRAGMGIFDVGGGHEKSELSGSWICTTFIPTHAVRAGPSLFGALSKIWLGRPNSRAKHFASLVSRKEHFQF